MVNVPWDVKKVNSVYNWAANYDRDGIDYLKEEISYLIGFQPDFTMVVEWEAVGELVDAIGPVWFDVPYDMNYEDGTQDLYIHLQAGYQEIDGDKAMQLLRWRKNNKIENGKLIVYGGYPSGDLGRIETQQAFLTAVIDTCLQNLTIDKIPALAQIFFNNVDTRGTLTVNNLAWFCPGGHSGRPEHGQRQLHDPALRGGVGVQPDGGQQSVLCGAHPGSDPGDDQHLLQPYLEDIRLDQLDLMSVNDERSLSSTSGHVEDTYAAKPQNSGSSSSGSSSGSSSSSGSGSSGSSATESTAPSKTPTPEVTSTPAPSSSPVASAQPSATPAPTPSPAASAQPVETPTPTPTPHPRAGGYPAPESTPEIGPGMEPVE